MKNKSYILIIIISIINCSTNEMLSSTKEKIDTTKASLKEKIVAAKASLEKRYYSILLYAVGLKTPEVAIEAYQHLSPELKVEARSILEASGLLNNKPAPNYSYLKILRIAAAQQLLFAALVALRHIPTAYKDEAESTFEAAFGKPYEDFLGG